MEQVIIEKKYMTNLMAKMFVSQTLFVYLQ